MSKVINYLMIVAALAVALLSAYKVGLKKGLHDGDRAAYATITKSFEDEKSEVGSFCAFHVALFDLNRQIDSLQKSLGGK